MTKKTKEKSKKGKRKFSEGRPYKLTEEFKEKFVALVQRGNYLDAICRFLRIDFSTYRKWMRKAKEICDKCEKDCTTEERKNCTLLCQFFHEVQEAQGMAEITIVSSWQETLNPKSKHFDYKSCRDFLARRYPKRWATRDYHKNEHRFKFDVKTLTDDQLRAIASGAMPGGVGTKRETEEAEEEF